MRLHFPHLLLFLVKTESVYYSPLQVVKRENVPSANSRGRPTGRVYEKAKGSANKVKQCCEVCRKPA